MRRYGINATAFEVSSAGAGKTANPKRTKILFVKPPAIESPPLRIFVIENHEDTLKYLTIYLEQLGHTVFSAATMTEALAALPSANCDVLISDMGLPDGNGWELLQRLQLSQPIYAIAMTGFGLGADRAKSKAVGFRHHLLKPFDPDELDAVLEEAARETAAARARSGE